MSGGKTTKETTNQNSSATVQLPAWMTAAGQKNYTDAANYSAANPVQTYTAPISADLSQNATMGSALARSSQGTGQADQDTARALTGAAASGTVSDINAGTFDKAAADQYMNPYLADVQGRTLDQMQRQNMIDSQSTKDQLQGAGAFGGTRQAVLEAQQGEAQNRNMLDYLASSNSDAYTNAQGQFNTDRSARVGAETTNNANRQAILDRMLAAGNQASNIGKASSDLNSTDISNLERTGAVEQATQGDQRASAYQEFLRMQGAGMDRYNQLAQILSGTPKDVTTTGTQNGTSTSKTSGSLIDTLMAAAQVAASAGAFSDPRLKRDVHLLERTASGLGIYRFAYLWDRAGDDPRVGVMADEVERLQPDAMGEPVLGFRTVDYSKLEGVFV